MKRNKQERTKLITEPDAEAIIRKYMEKSGLPKQRAGNELIRLAGKIKRLIPVEAESAP